MIAFWCLILCVGVLCSSYSHHKAPCNLWLAVTSYLDITISLVGRVSIFYPLIPPPADTVQTHLPLLHLPGKIQISKCTFILFPFFLQKVPKAAIFIKEKDRKTHWSDFLYIWLEKTSPKLNQHTNLPTLISHPVYHLALKEKREVNIIAAGGWEKTPLGQEGCLEQLHPVCEPPVIGLPRPSFSVDFFSF